MPTVILWIPELGLFLCTLLLALEGARVAGGSVLYQLCPIRCSPSTSLVYTAHHGYGTCPTLVSLRLQAYLWLLRQTLESLWSPGPVREAPGQQLFLQVACTSPMFSSGDSEWVFCNICEHTLETGCGSWINARLYNKNKWPTLRQAALL